MEMCRVCLNTENEMIALDETFIFNYNTITTLHIALLDGMPQSTCQTCFNTVNYFIEFREKCIATEKTLREVTLLQTNEDMKTENGTLINELQKTATHCKEIKIEPKEEKEVSNLLDNFDVTYDVYEDDLIVYKYKDDKKEKKNKIKKSKKSLIKTAKLINLNGIQGQWLCGICSKGFEDKVKLNTHLDSHKKDRSCVLCDDVVNSFSQLLAHRIMHLPLNQHKCHICDKRYKASLYLEHHYRNVHIEEDSPYLACKQCTTICSTPKKLRNHTLQVHSGLRYFCDVCSKGFRAKTNLKSHIKLHSDNKSYVCDLCGFACKYSGGLQDHKIRRHNPKKVYCKNCKRPFPNQEAHDKHKCRNAERICPICGSQIIGSSALSRHLRIHSNVARYECPRCPAKYKSKTALMVHTDRHDGNKTKQCEYCPAKFYSGTVLIKHRRIHTGEKPYVCKVCNKGFTGNHNLKVHMKVHGEYLIVKKNDDKDIYDDKDIS